MPASPFPLPSENIQCFLHGPITIFEHIGGVLKLICFEYVPGNREVGQSYDSRRFTFALAKPVGSPGKVTHSYVSKRV